MPKMGQKFTTFSPLTILKATLAYKRGVKPKIIKDKIGVNHSTFWRWKERYLDDAEKFENLLREAARTGQCPDLLDEWL